jgi:hypothetical protein
MAFPCSPWRHGIGTVDDVITLRRQVFGLRLLWPVVEESSLAAVHFAYLLQANNVGIKLRNGLREVVDFQAPVRTQTLHALVDVVGRNPYTRHSKPLWVTLEAKPGNSKMASAFEGEKHFLAANIWGNHW